MSDDVKSRTVVRRTPFPASATSPLVPPIVPSAVFVARDADQMNGIYEGRERGFTYAREGSPNAEQLAAKIAALEGAESGLVTSSGMSAVAAIVLGLLEAGDHLVAGSQLYGRTLRLVSQELPRLGFSTDVVDVSDAAQVEAAIRPDTRLLLVEVVSNPLLRVADIAALGAMARSRGVLLVVDNTFPTPLALRPLSLGAHVVFHSITKMLAGHSDVTLGVVCSSSALAVPIRDTIVTWGLNGSPFDCWLAERGMNTLEIRIRRASANAAALADLLAGQPVVRRVFYPGRADHPDHAVARRLFGDQFGNMVTFELDGGRDAVNRFMRALESIPFAPTLGDVSTIVSHPAVTSHRGLTPEARDALGIREGTIRVSVGVEEYPLLESEFRAALAGF
ncbi:MAG TPA: aminotransferase class I/II-fold pyridoxal phosphate-dependent enzyme [Vicinamibacterales bacterium]|nr:aminotransferase class I/II-fold pyridoxal phosphate-dependent enzyme [Vicinamibacterales bacterium]